MNVFSKFFTELSKKSLNQKHINEFSDFSSLEDLDVLTASEVIWQSDRDTSRNYLTFCIRRQENDLWDLQVDYTNLNYARDLIHDQIKCNLPEKYLGLSAEEAFMEVLKYEVLSGLATLKHPTCSIFVEEPNEPPMLSKKQRFITATKATFKK